MTRIYSTADLIDHLSEATDLELAVCYDHCENEDALYPFWMIDVERRHRDLDLTDLEGLLDSLGD
jgi:hypothetical protein